MPAATARAVAEAPPRPAASNRRGPLAVAVSASQRLERPAVRCCPSLAAPPASAPSRSLALPASPLGALGLGRRPACGVASLAARPLTPRLAWPASSLASSPSLSLTRDLVSPFALLLHQSLAVSQSSALRFHDKGRHPTPCLIWRAASLASPWHRLRVTRAPCPYARRLAGICARKAIEAWPPGLDSCDDRSRGQYIRGTRYPHRPWPDLDLLRRSRRPLWQLPNRALPLPLDQMPVWPRPRIY